MKKNNKLIMLLVLLITIIELSVFNIKAIADDDIADTSSAIEQYNVNTQSECLEQEGAVDNSATNQELAVSTANMVITWTGLLFTVIAIAISVIGFLGFKEIGDLKKREIQLNAFFEKTKQVLEKAEEIEKTASNRFESMSREYKKNIENVIQASYYYTIGASKYKLGDHNEAIKFLEEARRYNPNNTEVICLIGKSYAHLGELKTAEDSFNSAISIDSNCADAYRGIAKLYRYTNNNKSLENAKKAAELAPFDPEALTYYGLLLMQDGQREDALVYLLNSHRIKNHPDTSFFISLIYFQDGAWERAEDYIDQAIHGYSEEDTYGSYRELWMELSKWIKGMLPPVDNDKLEKALEHLKLINQIECSRRTRKSVASHIRTVLDSLSIEQDYVKQCELAYTVDLDYSVSKSNSGRSNGNL